MGRRGAWLLLALLPAAGCSVRDLSTADRMSRGLVIVLPGIEGRSAYNYNLARGLDDGGVAAAIEIYDWNVPLPGGAIINLTALERNRQQARKLVERIKTYQDTYPGRTVHLVGHSGGAGMAVLTLERMPQDRQITAAVLLAGAISPKHDLTRALRRTEYGIFNYYSPSDISFLTVGTTLFGNIDRSHGPAAGAVGFEAPEELGEEGRRLYKKLHQIKWSRQMAHYGHTGSHVGWTERPFVRKYLAPLIVEQQTREWRYVREGGGTVGPVRTGAR